MIKILCESFFDLLPITDKSIEFVGSLVICYQLPAHSEDATEGKVVSDSKHRLQTRRIGTLISKH